MDMFVKTDLCLVLVLGFSRASGLLVAFKVFVFLFVPLFLFQCLDGLFMFCFLSRDFLVFVACILLSKGVEKTLTVFGLFDSLVLYCLKTDCQVF